MSGLATAIKAWGRELGFQSVGIADIDLSGAAVHLAEWVGRGYHGEMDYMAKHGSRRSRPDELMPGTTRVICARMDYKPESADSEEVLGEGGKAFVARYALGRDYHKVMRARLQALGGAHRAGSRVRRGTVYSRIPRR